MSGSILVLRPEPGASETAARAREMGLDAVVAPLFVVSQLAWHPPDPARFDAILLTSANAARHGGEGLGRFAALPCYAVGEATAAAAAKAGFESVEAGATDGGAVLAEMAAGGVRRVLHLCGRDRIALEHCELAIEAHAVYAAEAVEALPDEAGAALSDGVIALIHSPRAGAVFGRLVDDAGLPRSAIRLAAISSAAATSAGAGWGRVAAAPSPTDEALLEVAAKLCKTGDHEVLQEDGDERL